MSAGAAISGWEAKLRLKIAEVKAKYSTGTFSGSTITADVLPYLRGAEVGATLASANAADRAAFREQSLGLKGIYDWAKSRPDATLKASSALIETMRKYMIAYIETLISAGRPVLERQGSINETVDAVLDAPADLAGWLLDQPLKALGLPTWLLPIMVIAALVFVAAYFRRSFA